MSSENQTTPILLPALCAVIILPSLVYLAGRAWLPSEGAVIDLLGAPSGPGVLIGEVIRPDSGLRPEDQLIAIERRPIDDWIEQALALEIQPRSEQVRAYSVIRNGETIEVKVRLGPAGLLQQVGENWPSYLFLAYLLAVAAFIYARRPGVPAARTLLLSSSSIFASGTIFFTGLQPSEMVQGWTLWAFIWGSLVVYAISMGAIVHFALTFPKVRPILRKRPRSVILVYAGVWIPYLAAVALGSSSLNSTSAKFLLALRAAGLFTAISAPLGLGVLLTGYVRSFDARERRQTRWLLWSATVVILPWIGLSVIPPLLGAAPIVPQFALSLLWLLLPTAFGIAIVRDSLFDIDAVINRTLVYVLLTLALVAVYLAVVVTLQQVFELLTGQQSPVAVVISTLIIAAIFDPLRSRIQTLIDRRFYRSRYDAARAVNELSREMQRRVELAEMSETMLSVVQDSLQPTHLSLWLRQSDPER